MMFRLKLLLLSSILSFLAGNVFAQKGSLTVDVSTPDSYLIINNDTTLIDEPKIIELKLEHGTHEIQNFKKDHLIRKDIINVSATPYQLKFNPLVMIPSLDESEKKIILNNVDFKGIKFTPIRSYNSRSRFNSSSSKSKNYTGNLALRFDPRLQEQMIGRFMRKNDLVEDEEKLGFAITENNINPDIEVNSISMEDYRTDVERYTFKCKFRLLDLKLTPLDSAEFYCVLENNFGRIETSSLTDMIIEKLCVYVNSSSWKGLLNSDGIGKKVNQKFNLWAVQNVNDYIEARKAVVTIVTKNGHGSGCLVTKGGLLVTNAHVIKGLQTVEVITFFGDTIKGTVEDYNPIADLAIVQLEDSVDYAFKIKSSTEPIEVGKRVFAIGSPLSPLLSQSISDGIISTELPLNGVNYIQTDTKVNSGNSGGALVDEHGNLLGIVNAKIVDFSVEGISFAIPVSEILIHFSSYE